MIQIEVGGAFGNGGEPLLGYPARHVFHITATPPGSFDGIIKSWKNRNGLSPHATADLVGFRVAQHVPVTRSATTLANGVGPWVGGTVKAPHSPNKTGYCLQTETCANYEHVADWGLDEYRWLAEAMIVPLWDDLRIHTGETIAPVFWSEARRMTWGEWIRFNGICGHQHVPFQGPSWHGDPGPHMRWDQLVSGITRDQEEEVTEQEIQAIADRVWARVISCTNGAVVPASDALMWTHHEARLAGEYAREAQSSAAGAKTAADGTASMVAAGTPVTGLDYAKLAKALVDELRK